jgi:hypothetical protein
MYTSYDSNVFPSYEEELKDWEEYCMHRILNFNQDIKMYTDSCMKFNRPLPNPNDVKNNLEFLIQSLQKMKPQKSKYENNF